MQETRGGGCVHAESIPMQWQQKVLLVDRAGPWRDEIMARVASTQPDCVVTRDNVVDVRDAITGEHRPHAVIVGQSLADGDGHQEVASLFNTPAIRRSIVKAEPGLPVAWLIAEPLTDRNLDWLSSFSRLGVNGYLFRRDPVATSAARLLRLYLDESLYDGSYAMELEALLRRGDKTVPAFIERISRECARLRTRADQVKNLFAVGEWFYVTFSVEELQVCCPAVLRGFEYRRPRGFPARSCLFDIGFGSVDASAAAVLDQVMKRIQAKATPLSDVTQPLVLP